MRAENAGKQIADSLIELIYLISQKSTAKRVLNALIKELQDRYYEFKR